MASYSSPHSVQQAQPEARASTCSSTRSSSRWSSAVDPPACADNARELFDKVDEIGVGEFNDEFERYVAMRLKDMITDMGNPGKQLMYGSDWPLVRMKPYVKLLRALNLSPEQLENVAWMTAARLFRIDESVLVRPSAAEG